MTENQITSLLVTSQNEHITTINEKNIYSFMREYKQDGETKSTTVTINNQYAVARLTNIDAVITLNKKSNIALAIELARLKKSVAEENGFKTVSQLVHAIHDDLSETTINSYRRVGVIFGDLSTEVFKWKDEIPQNTSITNLVQVVGLVNASKDTDSITQEQALEAVREFKKRYIDSEDIHLLLPLSKLKDEIKRVQNTVDSTSTEIGDNTEPQKSEPQKSEPQKSEPQKSEPQKSEPQKSEPQKSELQKMSDEEKAEYYIEYIANIVSDFPNNKKIESLVYKLQEELKKLLK